jgi:hypothetical protein
MLSASASLRSLYSGALPPSASSLAAAAGPSAPPTPLAPPAPVQYPNPYNIQNWQMQPVGLNSRPDYPPAKSPVMGMPFPCEFSGRSIGCSVLLAAAPATTAAWLRADP